MSLKLTGQEIIKPTIDRTANCNEPCKDSIILNSGYNPTTNTAIAIGVIDPFWKIKANTCGLPSCTPSCSSVAIDKSVKTPSYLNPILPSTWISYATSYNLNLGCSITFEREFYVNQNTIISGKISVAFDNSGFWELVGPIVVPSTSNPIVASGSYPVTTPADLNFKNYKTFTFSSKKSISCGKYILRVKLVNTEGYTAMTTLCTIKASNSSLSNSNGCCLRCN
ncbi:MAG: hypothetical protein ABIO44_09670 [Saprospiraceae bacterium]